MIYNFETASIDSTSCMHTGGHGNTSVSITMIYKPIPTPPPPGPAGWQPTPFSRLTEIAAKGKDDVDSFVQHRLFLDHSENGFV
jgi:hypothetical protein